jgi:hypothetical protein
MTKQPPKDFEDWPREKRLCYDIHGCVRHELGGIEVLQESPLNADDTKQLLNDMLKRMKDADKMAVELMGIISKKEREGAL